MRSQCDYIMQLLLYMQTDLSHLLMTLYEQIFSVWKVLTANHMKGHQKMFFFGQCLSAPMDDCLLYDGGEGN